MSLRSPLSRVLGLGSAKEGVSHWWWQRITSIALVPLGVWFVYSVVRLLSGDHSTSIQWLRSPVQAALLISFSVTVFWHAFLGFQVVIEDYVHAEWLKVTSLMVLKMLLALLLVVTVLMIFQIFVSSSYA